MIFGVSFPCLDPLPSHQHVGVDGEVVAPRQDLAAVAVGEPLEVAKVSEQARLGRDGHVLRQVHQSAHRSVEGDRTVGTKGRVGHYRGLWNRQFTAASLCLARCCRITGETVVRLPVALVIHAKL